MSIERDCFKPFRPGFDLTNRFHLRDNINGYYVSTVDVGIDMNMGIGEPLYYETMIFKNDGHTVSKETLVKDWTGLYCERYSTEEQARAGHLKACELVKQGKIMED